MVRSLVIVRVSFVSYSFYCNGLIICFAIQLILQLYITYIIYQAGRPSTPTSPAANKVLAADNNSPSPKVSPGVIQGSPTKSDLSVISPLPTNTNNQMTGSHTSSSNRSNTPTPSLDGSQSSTHSRKRSLRNSTSALGLDKMIDEKRDAKTMSERVVHIEVCCYLLSMILYCSCVLFAILCFVC